MKVAISKKFKNLFFALNPSLVTFHNIIPHHIFGLLIYSDHFAYFINKNFDKPSPVIFSEVKNPKIVHILHLEVHNGK